MDVLSAFLLPFFFFLFFFFLWLNSTMCPTSCLFEVISPRLSKWHKEKTFFLLDPLQAQMVSYTVNPLLSGRKEKVISDDTASADCSWGRSELFFEVRRVHGISMLTEMAQLVLAVWTSHICQKRKENIYSQMLQTPGAYSPSFLDLHTDLIWGYLITILNVIYTVH